MSQTGDLSYNQIASFLAEVRNFSFLYSFPGAEKHREFVSLYCSAKADLHHTKKQENAAQKQEKVRPILKWNLEYIILIAAIEEKVK